MTVTSYNRILEITELSFLDVIGVPSLRDFQTPVKVSKITETPIRISMPDIDVTGRDLSGYRYLVGAKNLMLTKKFLELAKDGKPVPAPMIQAYMPAITMIDNIVKAGPGFVQMLRTLENRAKKSPNS